MAVNSEVIKVFEAYKDKFNRIPKQPHHLIAFSKARDDLSNLNYAQAKAVMDASIPNTDIALPSNVNMVAIANAFHQKDDEETEGALLNNEMEEEDDDDDNDAMYRMDGNETTAPDSLPHV